MRVTVCIRLFALVALAVPLAGCQAAQDATDTWGARQQGVQLVRADIARDTGSSAPRADLDELTTGNNDFAFDLYGTISGGEENLVVSPYSISEALAMTYAGARGETARQMAHTLGFTLPQERLHPAFNALDLGLADQSEIELSIANALWGQRGWTFLPVFVDTLARNYGAGMLLLDIKSDSEGAVKIINRWANDRTNGRIPQVLESLTGGEKLILTSAVYFNAKWDQPFPIGGTLQEDFHLLDGSLVRVDMMHQTDEFRYGEGDGYQAIGLPYVGGSLVMLIVLPGRGRFREIEERLSNGWLRQVESGMYTPKVILSMPRFGFETPAISLKDRLGSLGMVDAFACKKPGVPDFSGMDGSRELCLGDVQHKAFIDVNETRTEAAAVSMVKVVTVEVEKVVEPEPIVMRIDRPFLFLIRDRDTGSILFLGRVMNPAVPPALQ
jgi:serpin B